MALLVLGLAVGLLIGYILTSRLDRKVLIKQSSRVQTLESENIDLKQKLHEQAPYAEPA